MPNDRIPTEEEIIAGAIADTEQEIFDEALGQGEDDNDGDTSLEEMDDVPGETEAGDEETSEPDKATEDEGEADNPDDASTELDEEAEEAAQEEPDGSRRVPLARLRQETERRRAIEQERDNFRAQLAAYHAQVAHAEAQRRAAAERQDNQQSEDASIDLLFSKPADFMARERAQMRAELRHEMRSDHVNASLGEAHEEHGAEFEAAYKALTGANAADPVARAAVQRVWEAPNPGKALMRWWGEQQILRETQGDPAAYRQRVAKELMSDPEFRRELLEGMRGEAVRGDHGRPRTQTRLPKSLNGASGGGSVRNTDPELYNDSDASVFAFAMK
jgi:hypothetical protein